MGRGLAGERRLQHRYRQKTSSNSGDIKSTDDTDRQIERKFKSGGGVDVNLRKKSADLHGAGRADDAGGQRRGHGQLVVGDRGHVQRKIGDITNIQIDKLSANLSVKLRKIHRIHVK